ncbi:MAG TPA: helix-turn-helix transcriptional regulator [Streptosporangiaceae bacterium]|jgi:transcriptional regulator with XRE-family HTH domain
MNRPTAARKRFGSRLKKLRLSRRWRQEELAELLGYSTDFYRHVEAGRRTPPSTMGARIDEIYAIPAEIMADLGDEAQHDQTPINELRENEQSAKHIRIWEPRMVPGLLQTEDYARAVLDSEEDVADRMQRQKILTRENPAKLRAILDESVLWRKVGTYEQFRRQLLHLLELHVQIIPMSYGYHYGTPGPLTILEFDGQPTLVWREGQGIGTIADTEAAVQQARDIWENVLGLALSPEISAEMIKAIADELPEDE